MKIYLVNKNPIITKLVSLSATKAGLEIVETQEIETNIQAEVFIVDDESFTQESFEAYKQAFPETKTGLLYSRNNAKIEGFEEYVQKPFLPTDLVNLLAKMSGISLASEEESKIEELSGNEELDLSEFDDLGLDDESLGGDNPQVLDKNDINEVKDLLDSSEEGLEEAGSEANLAVDSNGDEQLDLGGMDFDLGLEETETPKDEPKEQDITENLTEDLQEQDLQEGDLQEESPEADLPQADLSDTDLPLEDLELTEETPKEAPQAPQEEAKGDAQKESLGEDLDLGDLGDLEIPEDTPAQEPKEEAKAEADLPQDTPQDLTEDLSDLNLDDLETPKDEPKEQDITENLTEDLQEQDLQEGDLQEESPKADLPLEDLELTEETPKEAPQAKGAETQETSIEDDFDSLSIEGLSEALGEPIAKEPNQAPLVPKENQNNITQNIQANSLEGLIAALQSLQSLQTQNLKELLNGATINITIQFPNKEDKN